MNSMAVGVYSSPPDAVRESIQAVPLTDPVDGRVRCLDAEIPFQVPDDAYRTHVVGPAQVQDLLHHFFRGLVRVVVGDAHSTLQPLVPRLPVPIAPKIEGRPRDSEAPTRCLYVAIPLGILDYALLTSDFPLFFRHPDPLGQCLPSS